MLTVYDSGNQIHMQCVHSVNRYLHVHNVYRPYFLVAGLIFDTIIKSFYFLTLTRYLAGLNEVAFV